MLELFTSSSFYLVLMLRSLLNPPFSVLFGPWSRALIISPSDDYLALPGYRLPPLQAKGPAKVRLTLTRPALCSQGKQLVPQEGLRTSWAVRAPSGLPSHLVTSQVSLLSLRGPNPKPLPVLGIKARSSFL